MLSYYLVCERDLSVLLLLSIHANFVVNYLKLNIIPMLCILQIIYHMLPFAFLMQKVGLCLTVNYNNNNNKWPFAWDCPGEPVPEETYTHPPS